MTPLFAELPLTTPKLSADAPGMFTLLSTTLSKVPLIFTSSIVLTWAPALIPFNLSSRVVVKSFVESPLPSTLSTLLPKSLIRFVILLCGIANIFKFFDSSIENSLELTPSITLTWAFASIPASFDASASVIKREPSTLSTLLSKAAWTSAVVE